MYISHRCPNPGYQIDAPIQANLDVAHVVACIGRVAHNIFFTNFSVVSRDVKSCDNWVEVADCDSYQGILGLPLKRNHIIIS